MRKNLQKKIPLKFILCSVVILAAFIVYLALPNAEEEADKKKSFEEMLEINHGIYPTANKRQRKIEDTAVNKKIPVITYENTNTNEIKADKPKESKPPDKTAKYNELLKTLAKYPVKNQETLTSVVNSFLLFKGYPANIVQTVITDIDQSKSKTDGNYMAANFDFTSGRMLISRDILNTLDRGEITAITAHELDHFDKLAKICKYMGTASFQKLFEENGITINAVFWNNAALYADTNNFNAEYYKNALIRFITQNKMELTSSYSDFYRLSENLRNPLEISAYEVSDYIYDLYGMEKHDGPVRRLAQKFNDVDWAIYNAIAKNPLIRNEKIPIFDYFYMNAVLAKFPQFEKEFNICVNQKDGDLTTFWLAFENSVKSFYQKGKMDNSTYAKMLDLLTQTEIEVQKGISKERIETAIKYKINTLVSNLVYPDALNCLRTLCVNYLQYIKKEEIKADEQELKCILLLLCIDNNFNIENKTDKISLYYVKIPEELTELYNIGKRRKFTFIYDNPAFKAKMKNNGNEPDLLTELLNKNRLDIKIKE